MLIFLTFFLSLTVGINSVLHEFHTSLAQVYYNKNAQSFEITIRVFTDDLEAALLQENSHIKVNLSDTQQADPVLTRYLNKHFAIIDKQNQRREMKFIGKEIEVDVTWLYIEIPMSSELEGMQIQNSILTEIFDDQVNIVTVKYLSTERTYLYRARQTLQKVDIK